MDKLGLRKMSFPFDWVRTNNLCDITELIKNKFQFFFDDLQIIDNDGDFPIINDFWDYTQEINSKKIKNKYFVFLHDNNHIQEFIIKYTRRIDRFYEILSDDKIKKIFVRLSKKNETDEIIKLEKVLQIFSNNHKIINYIYDKKIKSWQKDELNWQQIFT